MLANFSRKCAAFKAENCLSRELMDWFWWLVIENLFDCVTVVKVFLRASDDWRLSRKKSGFILQAKIT